MTHGDILPRMEYWRGTTVVAKELARIVYHMLKNNTTYQGFKGQPIHQHKLVAWPRRATFAPASLAAQL
jgi:hypothetical protein